MKSYLLWRHTTKELKEKGVKQVCQARERLPFYTFLNHKRWTHYYPKISWGRNSGTWLFYKIKVTASLEKQLPGNSEQRIVFRFLWNLVYLFWFFCWAHFPPYNPQTEQFWRKNSTHKKVFFPPEGIFKKYSYLYAVESLYFQDWYMKT